jgi:hypothetical protein
VSCPGDLYDKGTKELLSLLAGNNDQVLIILSNWKLFDQLEFTTWKQTDWSGGTGQNIWSDITDIYLEIMLIIR